jgi:hypothetical protein
MSDTDKTKPIWVQLYQNPQYRVEDHDHRHGECDLDANNIVEGYSWHGRGCNFWASNLGNQHIWQRCSKAEQCYRDRANGHARTLLRKQLRELMKTSKEDLEDCEYQSFPHRHQALWDSA